MLNMFSRKNGSFGLRHVLQAAPLTLTLLFVGTGQVQAQTANTCFLSTGLTATSSWKMMPSGSAFKNGDVVGRVSAQTQYYMPISHGETAEVLGRGDAGPNIYGAVPLAGMPGLGLVIRWGGYYGTTTLTPLIPAVPNGTVVSTRDWTRLLRARTTATYTLLQLYALELVVIDASVYKGGKLSYAETGKTMFVTSNQRGNNTPQACVNGWVDPMAALTGTLQVPELPRPSMPSCQFSTSTLYQNVNLAPVDPGQVAAYGSARPAGSAGQGRFTIRATSCSVGTKLNLYFTDNRSPSSTANYLSSSKSAVGVRLYYQDETSPVAYGPAPLGSTLPTRQAISAGPVPFENLGVEFSFVAQYVRLPNTTPNDVTAGPVNAQAVFTIMYP